MSFEYKVKVNEVEYILPNPKDVQVSHKNRIDTDSDASPQAEVVSDNKLAPTTCIIELHGSDLVTVGKSTLTTSALSTVRSLVDTFEKWKNDKQRMVIYTRYRNLYNMVIESIDIVENSDDHTGAMVAIAFVESAGHKYPKTPTGGTVRSQPTNQGIGKVKKKKVEPPKVEKGKGISVTDVRWPTYATLY